MAINKSDKMKIFGSAFILYTSATVFHMNFSNPEKNPAGTAGRFNNFVKKLFFFLYKP